MLQKYSEKACTCSKQTGGFDQQRSLKPTHPLFINLADKCLEFTSTFCVKMPLLVVSLLKYESAGSLHRCQNCPTLAVELMWYD